MTQATDINLANNAYVTGTLQKDFEFRNEIRGEKFFQSTIDVKRISGNHDVIPIVVSSNLLNGLNIKAGEKITIQGQFRSHRKNGSDGKRHLELFIYVLDINKQELENFDTDINIIYLYGKVSNPTIFKKTEKGKKMADVMILAPRKYRGQDYLPCITWGSMACYSQNLKVGDFVEICGRIQSRNYKKKVLDSYEDRVAYEVSAFNIIKVN